MAKQKIIVKDTTVRIEGEFICITDIAKSGRGTVSDIVNGYLRNKNNIEFLGQWEQLNNESFNLDNSTKIKNNTGMNDFYISMKKWISETNAIGIRSKAGRYGGTFAHKEIAYHFATWFNSGFYLYLIKEFDRLKNDEAVNAGLRFELRREIAKANYPFQKLAIDKKDRKEGKRIGKKNKILRYANEADLLNVLLFGCTAKEWQLKNPKKKGNLRDYATIEELMILANIEYLNSKLIEWGSDQEQRAQLLKDAILEQTEVYSKSKAVQRIKEQDQQKLK